MEFKARVSNTFIMNMLLVAFALLMATSDFIWPPRPQGFWHYRYVGWLLIAFTRFLAYRKYLYKILTGSMVLMVNETHVHDLVKNIKYYWFDIEEIYDSNAYLSIKLYEPADYVKYIKSPVKRLWASNVIKGGKKTPFRINIDMVNVNPDVLLQVLDDYSEANINGKTEQ